MWLSLGSEKTDDFFMCSYLSQIYYNARTLLTMRGNLVFFASNSIYIIPCSETCFHLNSFYCSGSFFFHTYRLYVQVSVSRINCPIFRSFNFFLVFTLIILLISPKSGGNNNNKDN